MRQLSLYTPQRARRLAHQARLLWTDMLSMVAEMLRLANAHDPDSLSQQRMEFRTIQSVLRGFSDEHRLWAELRETGADRDGDDSLFRFLDEVQDIVDSRLKSVEREISSFSKRKNGITRAAHFGPQFHDALKRLRSIFADWETITLFLDLLDSPGPASISRLKPWNKKLAEIEKRTRARHGLTSDSLRCKKKRGRSIGCAVPYM